MTRVAALDCGTNSLRLLIADLGGAGAVDVVRRTEIVRLGQGVDSTGRLAPEALERTFRVLRAYTQEIDQHAAARTRMVATSALRDAANREDFVAGAESILGVAPEIVSGAEEAALSFSGATRSLGSTFAPPYLVIDIGGGSTEFVLGAASVDASISVDIGCVRLTERHLRDDPPSITQVAATVADVEAALEVVAERVPVDHAVTAVGVAGSVTTVAALALGLDRYDPQRIHGAVLPAAAIDTVTQRLVGLTRAQRAALSVMHPGRADVIAAGALVLTTICRRFGLDQIVASEHDILDGVAYSLG
jgi:exopolyphosphatase / guanosine-5'-triphosphate,3'-diphosphate pyrophosphatase